MVPLERNSGPILLQRVISRTFSEARVSGAQAVAHSNTAWLVLCSDICYYKWFTRMPFVYVRIFHFDRGKGRSQWKKRLLVLPHKTQPFSGCCVYVVMNSGALEHELPYLGHVTGKTQQQFRNQGMQWPSFCLKEWQQEGEVRWGKGKKKCGWRLLVSSGCSDQK